MKPLYKFDYQCDWGTGIKQKPMWLMDKDDCSFYAINYYYWQEPEWAIVKIYGSYHSDECGLYISEILKEKVTYKGRREKDIHDLINLSLYKEAYLILSKYLLLM